MSYDKLPKVWADKLLIPFSKMPCLDEGITLKKLLDTRRVNPYTIPGDTALVAFKMGLHRFLDSYAVYVRPDHADINVIIAYPTMNMMLKRFPRHFHKRDDTISIMQETIQQKFKKRNCPIDEDSIHEQYRPMVFPDDILEDAAYMAAKTIWAQILFRFTGEI